MTIHIHYGIITNKWKVFRCRFIALTVGARKGIQPVKSATLINLSQKGSVENTVNSLAFKTI